MRIVGIETIQHPDFRNIVWVQVTTEDGRVGLGETFRGADAVATCVLTDVADQVLGADAREIDRISKLLTEPYVGFRGSGVEMRAASAIDIALWDLAGQRQGVPVYDLLGGKSRASIRTYNTCAGYTYNKSGRQQRQVKAGEISADEGPYEDQKAFMTDAGTLAKSLLADGIGAMKIWPFDGAATRNGGTAISGVDIEQALVPFQQIRDAVGRRMDIMVEMHSMWDVPSAVRIAEALKPFDPVWIEDPIRMLSPVALARVQATGVPVCGSETLATRPVFLDFLMAGALDYVMLDVSWCGGLSEAKKIATLAEAFQRPVAPHDCTGPVVWMASTHLSLNAPNAAWQESVRAYYSSWYRGLVTTLPIVRDGAISVSEAPGLGMALSPSLLASPGLVRRGRTL